MWKSGAFKAECGCVCTREYAAGGKRAAPANCNQPRDPLTMIFDFQADAMPSEISGDVCIVGAGPAGITLAKRLAQGGLQVVLVVGGGRKVEDKFQDLYRGKAVPPGSHEPLEENRHRVFGGSTRVWGGRCIPF